MENRIIQERLMQLRKSMQEFGIDFYMIPTADFHNSEYVSDYFKVREFFSNFSGSNGTLVVSQKEAGLWTDGRYFIQAENELVGTTITLYRMQEEGVPTIAEYLGSNMEKGQTLGFDGRVVPAMEGLSLEEKLKEKEICFVYETDLADKIWINRPSLPKNQVKVLPEEINGKTVTEKLDEVRKQMKEADAEGFFLTKLDDLMWLLNVRGADVECNPVALSYGYFTMDEAFFFVQKQAMTQEAEAYFSAHGVEIRAYEEVFSFLEGKIPKGTRILTDERHCSYMVYKTLEKSCIPVKKKNPTELLKAVKNQVELENMESIYLQDSVAVTKFIYWLKKNIGKMEITEISAAEYLDGLRREIPGFLDLSFPTISGYKENAAMMHYEATKENHKVLEEEGMLLVDSGGQYLGGTTDVTRTIVLGEISEEIKKHYCAVAAGMLQLSAAKFLYGCTGRNLDILARQPLWDLNIDYKCGTGHGVGYILNVHEGPQSIRWRFAEGMQEAILEAGMDVTNEPGVYMEGSHGIRIENVLVVQNGVKNGDGQFMHFSTLTYVPLDPQALDRKYLNEKDIKCLNEYQSAVYEKISPFLSVEEQKWLKEETKAL